jgi:hypothetical protein
LCGENEPGFHVRMISGRYKGESIVDDGPIVHFITPVSA